VEPQEKREDGQDDEEELAAKNGIGKLTQDEAAKLAASR